MNENDETSVKCPRCGRFMKLGGYYSNEHLDSWEDSWTCSLAALHLSEAVSS